MYKPFFASSDYNELAIFGLVLFVGFFVTMFVRTWVFKKKKDYDSVAEMPLADEHREIANEKEVSQ